MSSLPKGWVKIKLGELIELKYGKALPAKVRDGIGFPVYGSNGVVGLHSEPLVCGGGLIIGRKGSFGEVHISNDNFSPIDTTYYVDTFPSGTKKYWYYQLKNLPLTKLNRSTAIPGLNRDDAYAQMISLPPDNEQKRIVEKLDEVLAQVDIIKARLDGIPSLLKRFRQSVLASAVSGKLTEEWCKSSNSSAKNDLTKELLENTAKTRKVEQTSSHELVVNKFPSAWRKTTFTELYKFIDYRGKTPNKSENGFRLYTAKNIKMGFVSNEPVEYLSESDYEAWMTRGFSRPGDIFFVTEGHTMGCTAINDLGSEIALAQRTLTLQPYGNVNTRFHHYYMMSDSFQKLVDLNATGSAAKGIKAAKFRGLPLPFPSYEEQNEIVRLVDQYFAFADTIEAQVKKAQARVNNLTQSILAKAFRGELVEQDPNDEPADKLLERIATARKEAEALAKAAKKAAPKKRTTKAKTTA
jgi:type I restriction enzyme S subunit